MDESINIAFGKGYERMAAWSDLLDDINLYPVADADTGRNLRISLSPLKFGQHQDLPKQLLMSAIGNSGNIASAFFSKFTRIQTCQNIRDAAVAGKEAAWEALQNPQPGTMLTVFSALTSAITSDERQQLFSQPDPIVEQLKASVLSTTELLPALQQADVVDSGALGMFLFFEGFFKCLADQSDALSNPYSLFGDRLTISTPIHDSGDEGYCIDTVVKPSTDMKDAVHRLSSIGDHVVAVPDGNRLKVHLHAPDVHTAEESITDLGELLSWKSEKIEGRQSQWEDPRIDSETVHIVTDAAGSVSRDAARHLGITLLDSYIIMEGNHLPESMVSADRLYKIMRQGNKVSTAQASNFERHQHYAYLTQRYSKLLYLCVGSVYTGNVNIARQWAAHHPNGHRMTVVDTGAASGRLGMIARCVTKMAKDGHNLSQVMQYAKTVSEKCDELIFLDQLKYLAAGGRISKSKGLIGDLLNVKPIVRPGCSGAQKIGSVNKEHKQVGFLLNHLKKALDRNTTTQVMLQYTDNKDRVVSHIQPRIQALWPRVRISVEPMSLTSGVHMGPGTWAAAYLPESADRIG